MTDTEWTPATLDDLKIGQMVRLEHDDGSVLVRTVMLNPFAGDIGAWAKIWLIETDRSTERFVSALTSKGWNLFVPVPPKPVLPSEPNTIWADKNGHPWFVTHLGNLATHQMELHGPAELAAPFVKLEPVAETATKIAARIEQIVSPNSEMWANAATAKAILRDVQLVAAEFGADLS